MLLLGLDTATLTLSAALVKREGGRDELLGRVDVPPPTHHSDLLPRVLEALLQKAGARPKDLGAFVIGIGPGSFTGLRIGLATAKGLCYAAKVPLVGASSLGAMALAALPEVEDGALLVPCFDARKGQVYCGLYRREGGGLVTESAEEVLFPEELIERLAGRPAHVFGPGRQNYEALRALPPPSTKVEVPDAFALVRLATEIPPYSKESVFALEPHYVRPSDAEWTVKPKKPKP